VVAGTAFAAVLGAVLLTYSRGAVLGIIGMASVFVIIYGRGLLNLWNVSILVCGLLATGYVIAQVAPQSYFDRVRTMTSLLPQDGLAGGGIVAEQDLDVAVEGRLGEMKAALQMFFDYPLMGVGYGNFELHYQQYELLMGLPPRHQKRSAHSLLLEIAAEQGLVGLGSFAVILFVMIRCVLSAVRDFNAAGNVDGARMAQALGFALLGYMLAALFLHNSYFRYFWVLGGIIFALPKITTAARRVCEEPGGASQTRTSAAAALTVAPR
jgi:O-antigen ligase